jgi:uncharacterized protein with HEPN domain
MTLRDDKLSLRHMLDAASEASALIQGKSKTCLDDERVLFLALFRLMEIIGEAANRVTVETQNKTPSIRWKEIISLRNRLIHGYDNVDKDILWQILEFDIPELISELQKELD